MLTGTDLRGRAVAIEILNWLMSDDAGAQNHTIACGTFAPSAGFAGAASSGGVSRGAVEAPFD